MPADRDLRAESLGCFSRANLLVISRGAKLPLFCIMCGDPAFGTPAKRNFKRYRFPLWIGGLVLLASGALATVRLVGFAMMAVSLLTSDSVALGIPLCEEHQNNQGAASLIGRILCFGGLIVAVTVSILRAPPLLILASYGLA